MAVKWCGATHFLQQVPHLDLHFFNHLSSICYMRGAILEWPVLLSLWDARAVGLYHVQIWHGSRAYLARHTSAQAHFAFTLPSV